MSGDTTGRGPFGINVYGHVSGNFGLAVAARGTLRALRHNAVDACVVDLYSGSRRTGHDRSFDSLACDDPAGRYDVSLFHTNPPNLWLHAAETPRRAWSPDRLRLMVPFWELPLLPPGTWSDVIAAMDLVLAPTRFVAEAVATSCPGTPVAHYPQAVFIPDGVVRSRAAFGLPDSAFVCLTVMDAGSGFERKNPLGSVRAFREAFPDVGPESARLVVKMTDRRDATEFAGQIDALVADVADDPRITVIESSMPYADLLSLNASSDVLLSLHRSEGLGLNLMEAMSVGTVVVATGWSGNMDFMTEENSVIVGCSPTPVVSAHKAYAPEAIGTGQYWMEPDIRDAAAGLRRLYDDRGRADALAARARLDMDAARARFLQAGWLDEVRRIRDSGEIATEAHARRTERFRHALHVGAAVRLRRGLIKRLRPAKRAVERMLDRGRSA